MSQCKHLSPFFPSTHFALVRYSSTRRNVRKLFCEANEINTIHQKRLAEYWLTIKDLADPWDTLPADLKIDPSDKIDVKKEKLMLQNHYFIERDFSWIEEDIDRKQGRIPGQPLPEEEKKERNMLRKKQQKRRKMAKKAERAKMDKSLVPALVENKIPPLPDISTLDTENLLDDKSIAFSNEMPENIDEIFGFEFPLKMQYSADDTQEKKQQKTINRARYAIKKQKKNLDWIENNKETLEKDLHIIENTSAADLKEIFGGAPEDIAERAENKFKELGLSSLQDISKKDVPKPIANQMSHENTRNYMESIIVQTTRGVQEMLRDVRDESMSDVSVFTDKVNNMKEAFEAHIRNVRKETPDETAVIDEYTAQINRLEEMLKEYTEEYSDLLPPNEKNEILRKFTPVGVIKPRDPLYPPAPTFDDLDSLIDVRHQDAIDLNIAKDNAKRKNIKLIPRATIPNSAHAPGPLRKQLHMVRVRCVLEYLNELQRLKERNEAWQIVDIDKLCESLPPIDDPEKQEMMEEVHLMLRNSNQWTGPQKRKFLIGMHHMLTKEFDNPGKYDESALDAYNHLIEPAPLSRTL